jgi:hypothetical protein
LKPQLSSKFPNHKKEEEILPLENMSKFEDERFSNFGKSFILKTYKNSGTMVEQRT